MHIVWATTGEWLLAELLCLEGDLLKMDPVHFQSVWLMSRVEWRWGGGRGGGGGDGCGG